MAVQPIRTGDLNSRVTIQQPIYEDDGAGGRQLTEWADVLTVWAKMAPVNGGETFRFGVERATQFYRVTIRFRTGVSTTNRLMFNGSALNIRSCADPDGRREQLLIMAESGVADG